MICSMNSDTELKDKYFAMVLWIHIYKGVTYKILIDTNRPQINVVSSLSSIVNLVGSIATLVTNS